MRLAGEGHLSALLLCSVEAADFFSYCSLHPSKEGVWVRPPACPPPPGCKGKGYRGAYESGDTWAASPGRKAKAGSASDRKLRKIFAQ